VEIATGAAQSPVAAAATPFAASPFAESKDIHLSCTKKKLQKLAENNKRDSYAKDNNYDT
jgi:hypothetical protein